MSYRKPAVAGRLLAWICAVAVMPAFAFGLDDVALRAKALAEQPYKKPENTLPRELAELGYDQVRDIRFKPDRALWRNRKLPFEVQFFHPGGVYNLPVKINVIGSGGINPLSFNAADFDYGNNKQLDPTKLKDVGFAGFRVHANVNKADYKDEVLVFQGASYFRGLGKGQRYGLSARGLAVDTAQLSGEEFPYFTEFWLSWPSAKDDHLVIYALLDSRRVTGAYRFELKPGDTTVMNVDARIFPREKIDKLGIAPLTSMFFFGENQRPQIEDYRPEVHDSDGLLVNTGSDEWIWRPLSNPRRLLVTSFSTTNPKGFGLMQRDRAFSSYEDLEARYDLRPSAWVMPRGNWGEGRVELVQIPSPDETNDNVVAYWVSDHPPKPGDSMNVSYAVSFQRDDLTAPPTSWVTQSRRGHGWTKEADNTIRMMVDFEGPSLKGLDKDSKVFPGLWLSDNGELLERQVSPNEATGGWRLSFRFRRINPEKPVEMRAFLRRDQESISETWSYILAP
ncbi:glucan biosynthesis protein G [Hydrocarboniphaga effusa]|uniref:glucan biosynthesis protein G n=1 Tax=Hydrocarboniphaga effusa TaxID=243629 RepID=UPI003CC7E871